MNKEPEKPSIEELARRLAESVPAGLRSMRDELEQNFRSVLKSGLGRLDLVTREEFEVQQLVLARTREKLESMEARLEEIEAPLAAESAAGKQSAARKNPASSGDESG